MVRWDKIFHVGPRVESFLSNSNLLNVYYILSKLALSSYLYSIQKPVQRFESILPKNQLFNNTWRVQQISKKKAIEFYHRSCIKSIKYIFIYNILISWLINHFERCNCVVAFLFMCSTWQFLRNVHFRLKNSTWLREWDLYWIYSTLGKSLKKTRNL